MKGEIVSGSKGSFEAPFGLFTYQRRLLYFFSLMIIGMIYTVQEFKGGGGSRSWELVEYGFESEMDDFYLFT